MCIEITLSLSQIGLQKYTYEVHAEKDSIEH